MECPAGRDVSRRTDPIHHREVLIIRVYDIEEMQGKLGTAHMSMIPIADNISGALMSRFRKLFPVRSKQRNQPNSCFRAPALARRRGDLADCTLPSCCVACSRRALVLLQIGGTATREEPVFIRKSVDAGLYTIVPCCDGYLCQAQS
jgi:hypothetical protein